MDSNSVECNNLEEKLLTVYNLFKEGNFTNAVGILEENLSYSFESEELVSALKCARFWEERKRILRGISELSEKGEFLLKQWKNFIFFLERMKDVFDRSTYSIKEYVFGEALKYYLKIFEKIGGHDEELLLRIGKCYKGNGDYEKAIYYLEKANKRKLDSPEILAELADCYALINEVRISKIFFKEAFFIDPQRIDISSLESLLIKKIIKKVKEIGKKSPALKEWIPVYGSIFGVFNIRREIQPLEYSRLRQTIEEYENYLEDRKEDSHISEEILVPRLINRYLWLIDKYLNLNDEKNKIDEVLLKIKKIDYSIYELYTK